MAEPDRDEVGPEEGTVFRLTTDTGFQLEFSQSELTRFCESVLGRQLEMGGKHYGLVVSVNYLESRMGDAASRKLSFSGTLELWFRNSQNMMQREAWSVREAKRDETCM